MFIALHHRTTERHLAELEKVLECADPVGAVWHFQSGWEKTALGVECLALANHRKGIADMLAASTNASRVVAAAAIERAVGQLLLRSVKVPPVALGTMLVAIGRLLANEGSVGISSGHEEGRCLIDAHIDKVSS